MVPKTAQCHYLPIQSDRSFRLISIDYWRFFVKDGLEGYFCWVGCVVFFDNVLLLIVEAKIGVLAGETKNFKHVLFDYS